MTTWSATQYVKFEDERTRPARELLARVPLDVVADAVDLGCGPGNSTELVAGRYPAARLTGVDTSDDMLAAARKRLPRGTFVAGDAATWSPPAPVDLIFANAVLQWVPDHVSVVARLMGHVRPGGVFALQVPDNQMEPSHAAMRAVAAAGPWAAKFVAPIAREVIPPVEAYYDALVPFGAVDVWRTTYHHTMADAAAIVEWVKGTGLRPFLDRLDDRERPAFIAAYQARLAEAYPVRADGKVLFRFPRLFVVAQRAAG
ncbi:MAG TPA: trans-aconitate 2-methyltransferase [Bauldia sp.]|nr:trans-aconitate 2-methyltransferase [Bauldia sp.]